MKGKHLQNLSTHHKNCLFVRVALFYAGSLLIPTSQISSSSANKEMQ